MSLRLLVRDFSPMLRTIKMDIASEYHNTLLVTVIVVLNNTMFVCVCACVSV